MHEGLVAQPAQNWRDVEETLQTAARMHHHAVILVIGRNLDPVHGGEVVGPVVVGVEDLAHASHRASDGDVVAQTQGLEQPAIPHATREFGEHGVFAVAVLLERRLEGVVVEIEELAHAGRLATQQLCHARRRARLGIDFGEPPKQRPHHRLGRPHGLVQVDLSIHVEAAEEEALHRGQPLLAVDRHARPLFARCHHQTHRLQQPVEIEHAIAHARHVRVAEQVVATIDVEGPGHRAREVGDVALAVHEPFHASGGLRIDLPQDGVHLAARIEDEP